MWDAAEMKAKGLEHTGLRSSRQAVVSSIPGTTRDYIEGSITWDGTEVQMVDTGGLQLEEKTTGDKYQSWEMVEEIEQQCKIALSGADVILMVCEAHRQGTHPLDKDILLLLTKNMRNSSHNPEMFLVVNKVDSEEKSHMAMEFYELLKFGSLLGPVFVSASKRQGISDLLNKLVEIKSEKINKTSESKSQASLPEEGDEKSTHLSAVHQSPRVGLALIGRPNAGKSSLLNRLLGRQRAIVKDMPGTTRDAIGEIFTYKGTEIEITDTAGIKRDMKLDGASAALQRSIRDAASPRPKGIPGGPTKRDKRRRLTRAMRRDIERRRQRQLAMREEENAKMLEEERLALQEAKYDSLKDLDGYTLLRTKRVVNQAEVVIAVVDGENLFSSRDLQIVSQMFKQGLSVVIAINKMDKADVEQVNEFIHWIDHSLISMFVPIVEVSALRGWGINNLMEQTLGVHQKRRCPIPSRQAMATAQDIIDGIWRRQRGEQKISTKTKKGTTAGPKITAKGGLRVVHAVYFEGTPFASPGMCECLSICVYVFLNYLEGTPFASPGMCECCLYVYMYS
ncbi:hypothetical protein AAMO2058_000808000 [Amorphochlora amoebiformis]